MLNDWHMHLWLSAHLGLEAGPETHTLVDRSTPPTQGGTFEAADGAQSEAGLAAAVIIGVTSDHMSIPNEFATKYMAPSPARTVGFASVDPNTPGPRRPRRASGSPGRLTRSDNFTTKIILAHAGQPLSKP